MEFQTQPRIFVVEDNLLYQQLIGKELESLTSDIFFYTTGEACLQNLDKNPSIIILDYNLEGEINGLDTLHEIRKYDATIFVILFSNQKDLNTEENFVQYGSFKFLEKRAQSFRLLKKMINSTFLSFAK
jgi:CheY-like chemotaxis protein